MQALGFLEFAEIFDGLAIVHPDYISPYNPCYWNNLLSILSRFEALEKPVLVYEPISKPQTRKLFPESYIRPSYFSFQEEVDHIARMVGKRPEDVKLIFGGTIAEMCVSFYAESLCRVVDSSFFGIAGIPPEKPLGYGRIFSEIV